MDGQIYRIKVSARSNLYYRFLLLLFVLWLWALWLWPYYMPTKIKVGFFALLVVIFALELLANVRMAKQKVVLVGLSGRIVIYSDKTYAGWLLPTSRANFGFFYLSYLTELEGSSRAIIIFNDQIDTFDRRRLSRIITAARFSSGTKTSH